MSEPRELTPEEVDEIDALAASLPPLRVPGALLAETLAAMEAEIASAGVGGDEAPAPAEVVPLRPKRRWAGWSAGAVAALAAAALVFVMRPGAPGPAPTARLFVGGAGPRLPDVSLKVAVDDHGRKRRHQPDRALSAGDRLYFRAGVDHDAWVALVRVDGEGAAVVHSQAAGAGEVDLQLEGAPLSWQVEEGEGDAVFALIGAPGPVDAAAVEAALGAAYDPEDATRACRAALPLGARCDATTVKVQK